ncbi:MAG: histidine kinase [Deltaproteobacteria bacterium]|nr:histidine kinase [Deltaproteobacteria bacterium]
MQRRVREILLVSSPYDSFVLAEDGKLHEMLLSEFLEHNLSYAPGITRVATAREALELAADQRRFNLIISTMHIDDLPVHEFARSVREAGIETPLVLLTYDNRELADLLRRPEAAIFDRIFNWQGDFRIFLTIIKHVEDRMNVEADHAAVGVQVLILVEDSIRYYSSFLPLFYSELMQQSQRLIAEGRNLSQKLYRMRARPKVLLANDFEEAWGFYERYREDVLAIISDIRFPRDGAVDPEAGIELSRRVHADRPDLPIVLQSSEREHEPRAHEAGAAFLWKQSPTLLSDLRTFMLEHFSFGDFVFKLPGGGEAARARNLKQLEEVLETVPEESLLFHAQRDHFSHWLKARTEFLLAARLKPHKVTEYATTADMRRYLIEQLRENRLANYRGVVVDFDPQDLETSVNIARLGHGSIGGKARGLAFIAMLVKQFGLRDWFPDVRLVVPGSIVLCTSIFDRFIEDNRLQEFALSCEDDDEIRRRFRDARLPDDTLAELRSFLAGIHYPLAVRSSSILEDSLYQPFAGVYETLMVPNNDPSLEERLAQLAAAIRDVYASTFFRAAKDYVRATNYRLEEEKMAVIVQRVLGNPHEGRFYPHFSGVARSHNSYPVAPQCAEDGVVAVAAGLGQAVVDGSPVLDFCPRYPRQVLQLSDPRAYLKQSQREFYAVDLSPRPADDPAARGLLRLPLETAERDGMLSELVSTWDHQNEALYDGTSRPGVRLVSLAPLLKHDSFPLAEILRLLMEMGRWGMNSPVEIEFAVNLAPAGGGPRQFGVLQVRPLVLSHEAAELRLEGVADADLVCRSPRALGNGRIDGVRDVVFVDLEAFDRSRTAMAAAEVSERNARLQADGVPYLLLGLGRWGSRDPWLGIPVGWGQIAGARAIVEAGLPDLVVEPSQGSHFFQNLTSFQVGYFTVNAERGEGFVDWAWLRAQPTVARGVYVRHVRFDEPLVVKLDGRTQTGVIFKPGKGG